MLPGSAQTTSLSSFLSLYAALAAALMAICSLGVRSLNSLLRSRGVVGLWPLAGIGAKTKPARQSAAVRVRRCLENMVRKMAVLGTCRAVACILYPSREGAFYPLNKGNDARCRKGIGRR